MGALLTNHLPYSDAGLGLRRTVFLAPGTESTIAIERVVMSIEYQNLQLRIGGGWHTEPIPNPLPMG